MNIFFLGGGGGGVWRIFFGVLEIPDIFKKKSFLRWTLDAGPEPTHEEQIRVPPGVSVRCYVNWRAHLNVKQNVDPDELTYQKSLFKKNGKNRITKFWM